MPLISSCVSRYGTLRWNSSRHLKIFWRWEMECVWRDELSNVQNHFPASTFPASTASSASTVMFDADKFSGWKNFPGSFFHSYSLHSFCRTSLPLPSTGWAQSTFSSRCSLSSKQHHCLTSATPTMFPKKIWNAGNRTQGSWVWKQICQPLCYIVP